MAYSMRLGGGGRFKALAKKVAMSSMKAHQNMSPKTAKRIGGAVAAIQGRKKYGAAKMAKMAAAGRKRRA